MNRLFPLTLTLSRWEREQQSCAFICFKARPANSGARFFDRLAAIPPLPAGEGAELFEAKAVSI